MEYELQKIANLSGNKASIYTLRPSQGGRSLLENFIFENKAEFSKEVMEIYVGLQQIGKVTGIRDGFIKENEGNLFDGVVALFDRKKSNLRLYAVKFGSSLIIVGSGGHKPKSIRALQQDIILERENLVMRNISKEITRKMRDKEMKIVNDFMDFEGDLIFDIKDYD